MFERRSDLVRLLAVADAKRIVAAADLLAMTQPALSRILARLEREFGGRLFERLPDGVRPTRLGILVVGHARRIVRDIEDGEEAVAAEHAGHTGRFRVTAAPVWMQASVTPAVRTFHAAFPEVELKLRTATWREGVRLLSDGRSDLHCGGIDTGETLPPYLRRDRFPSVTASIVAAREHPLQTAGPKPRDLADWPWIDLDGPDASTGGGQPYLAAVFDELHRQTGRRVRAVVRAGSAGVPLLAGGPWLAWLPLKLIERLPGTPLKALPLTFDRRRYRTGFVVRRAAEDLAPFRMLRDVVHAAALGRRIRPNG